MFAIGARAQDAPLAVVNARIITSAGVDISKGVLVVHKGTIVAVGAGDKVTIPEGAAVLDATGKVIMPGLVDTHSHIGGIGGADSSGPMQPEVRVLDSINPLDSGFRRAVAGGQTTLNVMPGSGHLLSGQTVYLKMRGARSIEELAIRAAPKPGERAGRILGGIKMANGTNSIGSPPFSGTRGKSAAIARERLIKAQEYRAKLASHVAKVKEGKDEPAPDRDLALEALVEALDGTRIVHHHTHRADDILTVLRLQKEFGFRVVLHHTSEAWKVPAELKAAQDEGRLLGCSIILVDSPGGKLEAANLQMETGAVLEKAGVRTCIHTDDWINDARLFLRCGAMAVRAGMSRDSAIRALTIEGARMLDLGDRVGSLEAGKDADFIILSGLPFQTTTRVEQTFVEGEKVFDIAKPEDRLFATGGFGAGRDQEPYLCCAPNGGFQLFGKAWGP
jgi:imidazolonepropionase-like amidohydrolase